MLDLFLAWLCGSATLLLGMWLGRRSIPETTIEIVTGPPTPRALHSVPQPEPAPVNDDLIPARAGGWAPPEVRDALTRADVELERARRARAHPVTVFDQDAEA